MNPSRAKTPSMKNLTIDNITDNVNISHSNCSDARLEYIMERLVTHIHDFARETRLSTKELTTGLNFLKDVGQSSTDVRQEFVLLSDVLGLSILIDAIDHPKPPSGTEGTVLGPFHTHDAEHLTNGDSLSHDPDGEPCLVICTVKDTTGKPLANVKIDVWETDSKGFYDVQHADRQGPDGRCVINSDEGGNFWFKAITPGPYPLPQDGPVGNLLRVLKRHAFRPAHIHFMFEKAGYDHLITSLYIKGDEYETSDAVFGVKETLIVPLRDVDVEQAAQYGVAQGTKLLTYDFVLVPDAEASALREKLALEAMQAQGKRMQIVEGLPVPDVD